MLDKEAQSSAFMALMYTFRKTRAAQNIFKPKEFRVTPIIRQLFAPPICSIKRSDVEAYLHIILIGLNKHYSAKQPGHTSSKTASCHQFNYRAHLNIHAGASNQYLKRTYEAAEASKNLPLGALMTYLTYR